MKGDFWLGPWLVQPQLNCVSDKDRNQEKRLEPKVMQVLVYLAEHAGRVVPKEELMKAVWPDVFVTDDALARCISELRRTLEDDAREPRFIQTIVKGGYRLIAEVKPVEEAETPEQGVPAVAILRRPAVLAAGFIVLALLSVAGYVGWRWFRSPSAPSADKVRLAVLPFQNLSGDPAQEYFSDGLTEEMITQLAGIQPGRLGVIALTTAMHYKRADKRIDQIGRELDVDYVIEGSVRQENNRVRIAVQLIQVTDQAHLWAQSYDRDLSSILAVQREVAQAVATRIRPALASSSAPETAAAQSVDPEAYLAYLMGNQSRRRLSPQDLESAIRHLQRAVDLDPTFARAWVALSSAHRMLGSWWGDVPPKKAFPLAKKAVDRALELDPTFGEAYASRGWIRFVYDWDWAGAEADLRRSIELSPDAGIAHSAYGNFLRAMKRFKEANRELEQALEIDPLSPLSVAEAAVNRVEIGEPKKAEELILRLAEMSPDQRPRFWGLAGFYSTTGKPQKAVEILEETLGIPRPDRISLLTLGRAYASLGRSAGTRQVLDLLLKTPDVSQAMIAELYLSVPDNEQAIRWFQKAFDARDSMMVWLNWTPPENPVWKDSRFQDLVRRMDFPQ